MQVEFMVFAELWGFITASHVGEMCLGNWNGLDLADFLNFG